MSTKTEKIKSVRNNGASALKNDKASNGSSTKAEPRKKSMYEEWIEKYGIEDSKSARLLLRAWKKSYENRDKRLDW